MIEVTIQSKIRAFFHPVICVVILLSNRGVWLQHVTQIKFRLFVHTTTSTPLSVSIGLSEYTVLILICKSCELHIFSIQIAYKLQGSITWLSIHYS